MNWSRVATKNVRKNGCAIAPFAPTSGLSVALSGKIVVSLSFRSVESVEGDTRRG